MMLAEKLISLRKSLNHDLNDSTQISTPLDLLKPMALRNIDLIAMNALINPKVMIQNHSVAITLIPRSFREDSKITSVSQGTQGRVQIDSDRTVIYIPNSKSSGDDSFTVTLIDTEGSTAVKTVNILKEKAPFRCQQEKWSKRFNEDR